MEGQKWGLRDGRLVCLLVDAIGLSTKASFVLDWQRLTPEHHKAEQKNIRPLESDFPDAAALLCFFVLL